MAAGASGALSRLRQTSTLKELVPVLCAAQARKRICSQVRQETPGFFRTGEQHLP